MDRKRERGGAKRGRGAKREEEERGSNNSHVGTYICWPQNCFTINGDTKLKDLRESNNAADFQHHSENLTDALQQLHPLPMKQF